MSALRLFTGARCGCKPGVQRDNCPACEGTGRALDFAAIRARNGVPRANEPLTVAQIERFNQRRRT